MPCEHYNHKNRTGLLFNRYHAAQLVNYLRVGTSQRWLVLEFWGAEPPAQRKAVDFGMIAPAVLKDVDVRPRGGAALE